MALFVSRKIKLKSGQEIEIRPFQPSDAKSLLNFRRQIATETTNTMQYIGQEYPSIEETGKRLAAQLEDKTTLNVGVFFNEVLIAYLNFRVPWTDHPWVSHLAQFGMMVLKDFSGLGVGKNLLRIQEEHALSIGVTRIEAMVRIANERGVKLYERNGYKIEGTRKKAAFINNEFVDEYFIAKLLDNESSTNEN